MKLADGQLVKTGAIIVRQRGLRLIPGTAVGVGKDHSIFAKKDGIVRFTKNVRLILPEKTDSGCLLMLSNRNLSQSPTVI